MENTDILIAGGGLAGLTAAARLAGTGADVTLVDPAGPTEEGGTADLRTTALLQPAIDTLDRAGAWAGMERVSAPLHCMRLIDAGGRQRIARETADFRADEISAKPFGQNVANTEIRRALEARLEAQGATRRQAAATGSFLRGARRVVRLSDGQQIAARLVIAADGRDSALRKAAGLSAHRWSYGQKALVFAVTHSAPHEGISTEIHSTGGPCTLVPMPDHEGSPSSSVVWMVPGPRAAQLAALDDPGLGTALTAETMGLYGPLTLIGGRAVWPIISQIAPKLTAPRLALVAEAVHVIPPIGAQGLNMSLRDVEVLTGLIETAEDPGAERVLRSYQSRRFPDIAARVAGVDMLNRAARAEWQPVRDLRRLGLKAIHEVQPIRQMAMRLGLGV